MLNTKAQQDVAATRKSADLRRLRKRKRGQGPGDLPCCAPRSSAGVGELAALGRCPQSACAPQWRDFILSPKQARLSAGSSERRGSLRPTPEDPSLFSKGDSRLGPGPLGLPGRPSSILGNSLPGTTGRIQFLRRPSRESCSARAAPLESRNRWDNPSRHWGVIEEHGGDFHTDTIPATATVQLGNYGRVTGVVIVTRGGSVGRLNGAQIETSIDGENWKSGYTFSQVSQVQRIDLSDQKIDAGFVRVIHPSQPSLHFHKIHVYGHKKN
jgi:hypothetical protein